MDHTTGTHPVLACADAIGSALKDVADLDPVFMTTPDKRAALLRLTELAGRVEELRLRVLAVAGDVAEQVAARDQAAWLAHAAHLDRPECRRDLRLARALETRWHLVAAGMREGTVSPAQAAAIVRALVDLPDDLDSEIRDRGRGAPGRAGRPVQAQVTTHLGPPGAPRGRPRGRRRGGAQAAGTR